MTRSSIIVALATLLALGCGDGTTADPNGHGGPDSGSDSGVDGGYDCDALTPGPFEPALVTGAVGSKDIAFDAEGNLVGSSDTVIYKTALDGTSELLVDDIWSCAGLRFLPSGSLIFTAEGDSTVSLFNGTNEAPLSVTAHTPLGLVVDLEGVFYVSDPPLGRITRVVLDPFDTTIVVEGAFGVSAMAFDADYDRMFFVTIGESDDQIFSVDIAEDGSFGEVQVFAEGVGDGWHVGLGMDACGNLYVTEHQCQGDMERSCLHRVSAAGEVEEEPLLVMDNAYLAGIEWGAGLGGWSADSIYLGEVNQDIVYRLDIGVPSKPRVYP